MTAETQARPGLRAWVALTSAEAKMIIRDYANLLIPLGLPVLVLVMSASTAGSEEIPGTDYTAFELFVLPIVLAMVLGYIGMINVPAFLAHYRRAGVLRRLAVTPASPAMVLVSQIVVSAAQALAGVSIALVVAGLVFDARMPASVVAVTAAFALSMAALYSIGMIVASIAPSTNSAIAMGVTLFLLLGALGGMFGGRQALPEVLQQLSPYLPFGAAVDALGAAWAGAPLDLVSILSLMTTVTVGTAISLIWFRWE